MEITDTESMLRDAIQRGRRLEYLTIGWNMFEAAVAIGAGVFAGSTALLGFGIDSLIESLVRLGIALEAPSRRKGRTA